MLFSLEGRLERHVKDPVLLITTPPDEVDTFSRLKNLVCKAIRQESWNHNVVKAIFPSPKLLITNIRVGLHEELLERVIDLAC